MPSPHPLKLRAWIEPTPAEAARRAAQFFADTVCEAVEARGRARVAVSGGSTPEAAFRLLAAPGEPFRQRIPWQSLELFWVDERCVAPDHPDSNFRMTRQALLDLVALPAGQIHRMEGELDPQLAAQRYEQALRTAFALAPGEFPEFDLVALGMGDDGHTASLFPHTAALPERFRMAVANFVPQKECWRLTLTIPVINRARNLFLLAAGSEKASTLREVFWGEHDPQRLPSQLLYPVGGILTLILDRSAAAQFPANSGDGPGLLESSR